jgi:hypothetical protein
VVVAPSSPLACKDDVASQCCRRDLNFSRVHLIITNPSRCWISTLFSSFYFIQTMFTSFVWSYLLCLPCDAAIVDVISTRLILTDHEHKFLISQCWFMCLTGLAEIVALFKLCLYRFSILSRCCGGSCATDSVNPGSAKPKGN